MKQGSKINNILWIMIKVLKEINRVLWQKVMGYSLQSVLLSSNSSTPQLFDGGRADIIPMLQIKGLWILRWRTGCSSFPSRMLPTAVLGNWRCSTKADGPTSFLFQHVICMRAGLFLSIPFLEELSALEPSSRPWHPSSFLWWATKSQWSAFCHRENSHFTNEWWHCT